MKFSTAAVAVLSALSIFGSANVRADVPSSVKRIDYALNALIATYGGRTDYAKMIELGFGPAKGVDEDIRSLLFRIESLINLYGHDFPSLKQAQIDVKGLEDHIGHYNDAVNFYQVAAQSGKASPAAIQNLKITLDHEKAQFLIDIQGWGGSSPIPRKIQSLVHNTFGMVANPVIEKKDRNLLLSRMLNYVNSLDTTVYDLTKLESGIHQLRRDARNMDYYPFAMSGVVAWDTTSCPVQAWAAYNKPKAISPAVAPIADKCKLSACLGGWVSDIQNQLAGIKQSAAVGGAAEGKDKEYAAPETIAAATAQYQRLKGGQKVLVQLRTELQKCLN